MADLTSAPVVADASLGTAAQTNKTASPVNGQTQEAQKSEGQSQFVTKEEIGAILKRLDGQSAILDKLSKRLPEKTTEASTSGTSDPIAKQLAELQDWKKQQEIREAEFREEKGIDRVEKALVKKGVEPEVAPRFAKLFWSENKANLNVENKTYDVSYKHSDTEASPIETFLDLYLQTDSGKLFLPSKPTPRSDGLKGTGSINQSGTVRIVEQHGSMVPQGIDPADIRKGKVIIR